MEERQIQVLLEQAEVQRRIGNHRGAIELCQRALAIDPDHARAHATLAFALLKARRLPGAGIEARTALSLDGGDPFIHSVAANVLLAERKLDAAWEHALVAIEADPTDATSQTLGAVIQRLRGDNAKARELLAEALSHDANHVWALTELARMEHQSGNAAAAAEHIALALAADAADVDAHAMAGWIELAAGDETTAEQHARFILNQNASSQQGLELFTAIRARRSTVLGLWWRWNTWISNRDDHRQVLLLIVSFVLVRIAIIVTDELGYELISRVLRLGWLGFCAYTWFAPDLFRRWLKEELGAVRLDPDY